MTCEQQCRSRGIVLLGEARETHVVRKSGQVHWQDEQLVQVDDLASFEATGFLVFTSFLHGFVVVVVQDGPLSFQDAHVLYTVVFGTLMMKHCSFT